MAVNFNQNAKFRRSAMHCLQEAAEAYAVTVLEGAVMLQLHRRRKTLTSKDIDY
eukprot:gene3033-3553_t